MPSASLPADCTLASALTAPLPPVAAAVLFLAPLPPGTARLEPTLCASDEMHLSTSRGEHDFRLSSTPSEWLFKVPITLVRKSAPASRQIVRLLLRGTLERQRWQLHTQVRQPPLCHLPWHQVCSTQHQPVRDNVRPADADNSLAGRLSDYEVRVGRRALCWLLNIRQQEATMCSHRKLTDLVEQQDDLLVGVSRADELLHFTAAVCKRVPCVQHLQDYICCLYHPHKLLVERAS